MTPSASSVSRRLAAGLALCLAVGAAALLVLGEGRSEAQDAARVSVMAALLRHHGCHACHAESDTLLGPSFRSIATMHAARKEVMTEVLAQKIIHGGAGNWGIVPMPPNERVSLPEAREIAAWILEQEQR